MNATITQFEPVEYQLAKRTFWTVYKSQTKNQHPVVLPKNAAILEELIRFWCYDPEVSLNPSKGVILYGEYGSGKTIVMKSLHKMADCFYDKIIHQSVMIPYKLMKSMNPATGQMRMEELLEEWKGHNMIIDDLGYEETGTTANYVHFGTSINVVQEIIRQRYELYQNRGIYTHFTTNKTMDEIQNVYGHGTSTRLMEMCQPVFWRGESLRK